MDVCRNGFLIPILTHSRRSRVAVRIFPSPFPSLYTHFFSLAIAMRKVSVHLSVCLSVCLSARLSNACIVTKLKICLDVYTIRISFSLLF